MGGGASECVSEPFLSSTQDVDRDKLFPRDWRLEVGNKGIKDAQLVLKQIDVISHQWK